MFLFDYINQNSTEFAKLCENHQVKKLYAFGSSVTDEFDPAASDIDLLVEIDENDPVSKGDLLLDFLECAEEFFGRHVDLLTDQPITNPFLKQSVAQTKVLIYDRERQEVFV